MPCAAASASPAVLLYRSFSSIRSKWPPTPGPTGSPSPQATGGTNQPVAPTVALPTSAARGTDTISSTTSISSTLGTARQGLNFDFLPGVGVACVLGGITMGAVFALFGV